ncbi:MAG TPA: DUF4097 family beta strand repeat-containing protein [Steroidobacteraceae bacterium]
MNVRSAKLPLCVGLSAALWLFASTSWAERIEKRASADPNGEVEIVNVAGSVRVIGWDRAEVELRGEVEDGVERVDFASDGKRTSIRVVLPRGRSRSADADLTVRIPATSALTVNTVSADQRIEGVRGAQRLQSVSGAIHAETSGEDFAAKTISGDIVVTGSGATKSAMYTISTVSGDLQASKIGGEIDIQTVSGDMRIAATEIARARVRTTNGDVELSTRLASDARLEAETINGDVELRLEEPIDAQFEMSTFNGDIESCFGDDTVRTNNRGAGRNLSFTRGSGSAKVRIKTLNGTVDVCRRR